MPWNIGARWLGPLAGVMLAWSLAGCHREETRVYQVAKDDSSPEAAPESTPQPTQPQMESPAPAAAAVPQLEYQLPEGWQEKPPSEMRVASFSVPGPDGQTADVSAIPLPIVGRDMELVNMWRSQVQLPPTSDPDAVNQAVPVAIGPERGRLFEYVSEQPMIGRYRQRILVATCSNGAMSWFFKMAGADAFVTSKKDQFLQFLKSLSFVDNTMAPPAMGRTGPAETTNAASIWTIPAGWKPMPPSQFLLAEFSISGSGGAKAEVNIAELAGEGGGLLANVNRWRGQIGLGAIGESDLSQMAQALDVPGAQATLVDFSGTNTKTGAPTRLVGAVVSENGQTWFYKLMGDPPVVAQQKNSFTKFIRSANYANAR